MAERGEAFTVMVVDDSMESLNALSKLLTLKGYRVVPFTRGETALAAAAKAPPDLVLLDVQMPGMDGFAVCRAMKASETLRDVPVLFMSGLHDTDAKLDAFAAGALDYITKPFWVEEVEARVRTHLKLASLQRALATYNRRLEELVAEKVAEISSAQIATIVALAKLAESRDDETGGHIERVRIYCKLLAEGCMAVGIGGGGVDARFIDTIYHASPLHDIGKVGIPDAILLKPGRLTPEEFEIIKTHTTIGAETLMAVHRAYPGNDLVRMGVDIALRHHERWDGSGYPGGVAGEAIPLSARIMAVADVYEALRSDRPYRKALAHEEVVAMIVADSGRYFDPALVRVFERLAPQVAVWSERAAAEGSSSASAAARSAALPR